MSYIKADVKNVHGKQTMAICPKCDKEHKMWMNWKGRGVPRKFCQACLHHLNYTMGGIDDVEPGFYNKYAAVHLAQGRS